MVPRKYATQVLDKSTQQSLKISDGMKNARPITTTSAAFLALELAQSHIPQAMEDRNHDRHYKSQW